jgi:hypothetical protein
MATPGSDFRLDLNGNTLAGKDSVTVDLSRAVGDLAPTPETGGATASRRRLGGLRDPEVSADGLWIADASALNGFPTVTVNPSTSDPPILQNISEVTVTINRTLVEEANSSNSGYIARSASVVDVTASFAVDVNAPEFNASGNASTQLISAWESTSGEIPIDIALPGGNTSFQSDFIVETIPATAEAESITESTIEVSSTGPITDTIYSGVGSGLSEILSEVFAQDPTPLTASFTTGNTSDYTVEGPVLPSELEITIPVESQEEGVSFSGTFPGAGAFTIS